MQSVLLWQSHVSAWHTSSVPVYSDLPIIRNRFLPSKIIHWIIFEVALYSQSVLETLFTFKRVSNFRKCA